jgi:hypothetical protein
MDIYGVEEPILRAASENFPNAPEVWYHGRGGRKTCLKHPVRLPGNA